MYFSFKLIPNTVAWILYLLSAVCFRGPLSESYPSHSLQGCTLFQCVSLVVLANVLYLSH